MSTYDITLPIAPFEKFHVKNTYHVHTANLPIEGLVSYVLTPTDKSDKNVYVLFRGTKDWGSVLRDLEPFAPGAGSFQLVAAHLIKFFSQAISQMGVIHENITVNICGHSLGAADAQNFCASLIKQIRACHVSKDLYSSDVLLYKKINVIKLFGFNSPGILQEVADAAFQDLQVLRGANLLTMECNWLLAAGDIVQQTGQKILFAEAMPILASVRLIKVTKKDNEKIWKNILGIHQIYQAAWASKEAHCTRYFINGETGAECLYLSNHNFDEAPVLQKKLDLKIQLLNTNAAYYAQVGLGALLSFTHNTFIRDYPLAMPLANACHWLGLNPVSPFALRLSVIKLLLLRKTLLSAQLLTVPIAQLSQPLVPAEYSSHRLTLHPIATAFVRELLLQAQSQRQSTPLLLMPSMPLSPPKKIVKPTTVTSENLNISHTLDSLYFRSKKAKSNRQIRPLSPIPQGEAIIVKSAIRNQAIKMLNEYIMQRNNDLNEIMPTTKTRFFRNTHLTIEKVKAAMQLRATIINCNDCEILLNALKQMKAQNLNAEAKMHKKYFVTKSQFGETLNALEKHFVATQSQRRFGF